jgi:hypothetical protein
VPIARHRRNSQDRLVDNLLVINLLD